MFGNRKDILSLFPLLELTNDTVITTHGVYLRGFEVLGMDSEHLEIDASASASEQLYAAIKSEVPEGTYLQFLLVADRRYDDVFERFESVPQPDNLVLAHQRQRRLDFLRNCRLRRFRIYLFVGAMAGFDGKEVAKLRADLHVAKLKEAEKLAKRVRLAFERVEELKLRSMTTEAIRALYHESLNDVAATPRREQERSKDGLRSNVGQGPLSCRERLLGESIQYDAGHVRVGRRLCKVLTLKTLPEQTQFTMMESLFHTGAEEFRASINIVIPPQGGWKVFLGRRRQVLAGMKDPDTDRANQSISKSVSEANLLDGQVNDGERVTLIGAQVAIFARDMSRLESEADGFRHYLQSGRHRLDFVEETAAHDREMFKTLPGLGVYFDRYRYRIGVTANAVDLMPLFANAPGDARPVFLIKNDRDELFSFDPMEPLRNNWNVVLLGASGAGKSVLANMVITTAMLSNLTRGRLLVVDFAGEEKSSYRNIVRMFDGAWVPVLSDRTDIGLSPFPQPLQTIHPKTQARISQIDLNFVATVTGILIANDRASETDPQEALLQEGLIKLAIRDLYNQPDRTDAPLYQDMSDVLASYRGTEGIEQTRLAKVLELVRFGILEEANVSLLRRPSNLGTDKSFAVLDLFGVNSLTPVAREAIVYTVCHLVTQAAFDDGDFEYKYVVLDEVAQLLRNKAMAVTIAELYATARKHNTSIWTVTQKYEDYVESGVAGTLAVNSHTKILLSHQNAREMEDLVVKHFSLEPRAEHLFRTLRTKKGERSQALLVSKVHDTGRKEGRDITAVLNIELSPFDYELATSDPADRKRQKQYIDANPDLPVYKVLDYLAYERPNRIVA